MADSEYKRGEMDAEQAKSTFNFVMVLTGWGIGISAWLAIWATMALLDQPVAGFFTGLVTLVLVKIVLNIFFKE